MLPQVSAEQNRSPLQPVTKEDVRAALFAMNPDNAPGPDGMNPKFFQHFWYLMGDDIWRFVKEYVESCKFPNGLGNANIVLLPKK